MADDLLSAGRSDSTYDASSIEVLEGLEPVRKRPGMYIGGTDERALHHLVAEVLDNAMDEAVAGHATRIEVELHADHAVTIRDNGRGIPVDPHPKFPDKSALEVILCTLHSGGKFGGNAYQTSGGLHGVGISVVNALSDHVRVEVARNRELFAQEFSRGLPRGPVQSLGPTPNRRGTTVTFHADEEIFGHHRMKPARLLKMARSKAYLFSGVEIRWKSHIDDGETPLEATFRFPGGLADYLAETLGQASTYTDRPFAGKVMFDDKFGEPGFVEWAITWTPSRDGFIQSYCNTVPTPEGGTHEAGFWAAILKGIRAYGELANNRKAKEITREDLAGGACALVSCFIRDPAFVGQTKDRLSSESAARMTEGAVRDHFDTWLGQDPKSAGAILDFLVLRAEERLRRRAEKETARKTATKKLRLPGKLVDCSSQTREGHRALHRRGRQRGRLRQDGARTQDPGPPAAPGQDPQRPRRRVLQAQPEHRDPRPLPGARRLHGHEVQRGRPALREGHHHDRRRRGRRPHRLAPDDLLLHPDARDDRQGPPLPRLPAALPADARGHRVYCLDEAEKECGLPRAWAGAARSTSPASRGWERWTPRTSRTPR
jgi:topoisomerase IV subunit B